MRSINLGALAQLLHFGVRAVGRTEWSVSKLLHPSPAPSFVRVPDVPKWSNVPTYATEFMVTPEAIDDLLVFVKTIEKLGLSQIPVINRVGPSGRQRLSDARLRGRK